ncbi:MAG: DUF6265 family protein [Longimicrobiales bacterium]
MRFTFDARTRIAAVVSVIVLIAVAAAVLDAASRRERQPSIDALNWIVGCWTMQSPRGATIVEQWAEPARDTLAGTSRTVRGNATVASEVMHIFARGDTLFFAALPTGQSYTEFRATSVSPTRATFENPAHDFPQRVSYSVAGDSLHARIDGVSNGTRRSADFPMRRTTCD